MPPTDNIRRLRRPEGALSSPGRRWKANWPAELKVDDRCVPCTVLDISSWGAQMEMDVAPEENSRVSLVIDTVGAITGAVVWRRDRRIGMQFDEQQLWIRRLHMLRLDPDTWQSSPRPQPRS
jgi:hypothetical protein